MTTEWKAMLLRSWLPIATGVVGSALVLVVFRKRLKSILASFSKTHQSTEEVDEEAYVEAMTELIGHTDEAPFITTPTRLLDFLFIGSEHNAKNVSLLEQLGITHVINTVDGHVNGLPSRKELYGNRFKYLNFLAQDRRNYYIMQHFKEVFDFIEDARQNGGKVFIHCSLGINRSGSLAAAYIIVHKQQGALTTAKDIKEARGVTLTNPGFQEQVVHFANRKGLLTLDKHLLPIGNSEAHNASLRARASLEKKIQGKDATIKLIFRDITS